MVQGCMSCVKYSLFVFNFVLVVCGLVLIIIGAIVTKRDLTQFLDNKYITLPIILIAAGCVIFIVAFFGCCGALRENHCMVLTFGLLVFLILVVEVAGGIAAFIYKGEVKDYIKQGMNSSLSQHKEDSLKIWDEMQIKFECCGVDGAADYVNRNFEIPKSCCKDEKSPCTAAEAWQKGCFKEMLDKANRHIAIIGAVAIGLCVIEILLCMFSLCLAIAIRRDIEGFDDY